MATERQCVIALDEYEEELAARKNVVGLGVVPLAEDDGARGAAKMAVAVYVKKKLPLDRLAEKDVVPATLKVRQGKRIVRVPTRIIEQGTVVKESASGK
jgi:hypothetical protein